jgi:hypothetical protein
VSAGGANRLARAFAAFDAANAEDPRGRELPYAERMTARLDAFAPDAPEHVRLAARAQHIRRWEIPRSSSPMDRAGYHQWRTRLYVHHAAVAGAILRDVGYSDELVARVGDLLRKRRLKSDPDVQLLEDVVCLVFLEHELTGFAATQEHEKVVDILRRTWAKMSPRGQQAALALDLPPEARALVAEALQ